MIELDILAAEALGRETVAYGLISPFRTAFSLSRNRMAFLLATSSYVVGQWENDPDKANTMHSMSAAKLGQLAHQLKSTLVRLEQDDIDPSSLTPLADLANMLGRSASSPYMAELCQTGKLTCYDLGILGTYVPRVQADALRGK